MKSLFIIFIHYFIYHLSCFLNHHLSSFYIYHLSSFITFLHLSSFFIYHLCLFSSFFIYQLYSFIIFIHSKLLTTFRYLSRAIIAFFILFSWVTSFWCFRIWPQLFYFGKHEKFRRLEINDSNEKGGIGSISLFFFVFSDQFISGTYSKSWIISS